MDEDKKRRLEAQLRQLMLNAEQGEEETNPVSEKRPVVVRVIRRRKGMPDRQIA